MISNQQSFIPYGRQTITEDDIAAVVHVLRSPFLTQGPAVPAFEQAVARKVNALHGVALNSATSALHIACLALGLAPGDRLWTRRSLLLLLQIAAGIAVLMLISLTLTL